MAKMNPNDIAGRANSLPLEEFETLVDVPDAVVEGIVSTLVCLDRKVRWEDVDVLLKAEQYSVNLEEFMWAYSNCPQEDRRGGVVPVYIDHAFNVVEVFFGGNRRDFDFVEDPFAGWDLVPAEQVVAFRYESCTGSLVEAVRAGDHFVVVRTKDVGTTTLRRLDRAGYRGFVATRQQKLEEAIYRFLNKEIGFAELREV